MGKDIDQFKAEMFGMTLWSKNTTMFFCRSVNQYINNSIVFVRELYNYIFIKNVGFYKVTTPYVNNRSCFKVYHSIEL